jgi:hypothetical protein
MANFGMATAPPFANTLAAVSSKSVTCREQVKALVPHSGGGRSAGLFSSPPCRPAVAIL